MELVQIPLHAFHHFGPEGPGQCIRMAKKSDIVIELVLILGNGLLFVCYNGVVIIQLGSLVQYAFAGGLGDAGQAVEHLGNRVAG